MTTRYLARTLCALALTLFQLVIPPDAVSEEPGKVVNKARVTKAKKAAAAKLAPVVLQNEISGQLVRPAGMEFKPYSLPATKRIDYYIVFYGAHWCPTCKKFTPKLTEFYREQRKRYNTSFEVIFVSADKSEDAMLQFMNGYKMPWPAVEFDQRRKIDGITALAGRGYPCLAVVDAKGKVITHSYGENRKGAYEDPAKTLESLEKMFKDSQKGNVARATR